MLLPTEPYFQANDIHTYHYQRPTQPTQIAQLPIRLISSYRHVPKGIRKVPQSQEQSYTVSFQVAAKHPDFPTDRYHESTQLLQQTAESVSESASNPTDALRGPESGFGSQHTVGKVLAIMTHRMLTSA